MLNAELLTSAKVQDFIELATKKKMDALQVSTHLAKEFSNEDRAAIMDYMALVPKFRDKFFAENSGKSAKNAPAAFLLCDKLALEQSTSTGGLKYTSGSFAVGTNLVAVVLQQQSSGFVSCASNSRLAPGSPSSTLIALLHSSFHYHFFLIRHRVFCRL